MVPGDYGAIEPFCEDSSDTQMVVVGELGGKWNGVGEGNCATVHPMFDGTVEHKWTCSAAGTEGNTRLHVEAQDEPKTGGTANANPASPGPWKWWSGLAAALQVIGCYATVGGEVHLITMDPLRDPDPEYPDDRSKDKVWNALGCVSDYPLDATTGLPPAPVGPPNADPLLLPAGTTTKHGNDTLTPDGKHPPGSRDSNYIAEIPEVPASWTAFKAEFSYSIWQCTTVGQNCEVKNWLVALDCLSRTTFEVPDPE